MVEKNSYIYEIDQQDLDFSQHATISSMVNVQLQTAGRDANRNGFGVGELNEKNYTWVLTRFSMAFERRAVRGESYEITTWIEDINRVTSSRNFSTTIGGIAVGDAASQWCMLDLTTRTAVDLSKLGQYRQNFVIPDRSPLPRMRKIRDIEPHRTMTREVWYSDIDFNGHVNTMRYIDMMFNMLSRDVIADVTRFKFDLQFQHECYVGEVLTVGVEDVDDGYIFAISRESGEVAVRGAFYTAY